MLEVYTVALLANIDTATIEAKHATIRHDVYTRVQTKAMKVLRASTAFVMRAASRPRMCVGGLGKGMGPASSSATAIADEHIAAQQEKKAGGGGAFRAYVSEQARGGGGLANTKQLAIRYRELPAAELARLQEAGKAATELHRAGASAFGIAPWQQRREEAKKYKQAQLQELRQQLVADAAGGAGRQSAVGVALLPSASMELPVGFDESHVTAMRLQCRVAAAHQLHEEVRHEI